MDNYEYSECGNCEGSGVIVFDADRNMEEVPAQRASQYPQTNYVNRQKCEVCEGTGNKNYFLDT